MNEQIVLCKYLGGSHLYGLNTPTSDIDERGIMMNTDPAYILGTKRFDQEVKNNENEDSNMTEIRRFLELARKGNTTTVEVLFSPIEKFSYLHPNIELLRQNRNSLIDPHKLFKVISSFIHAQTFLIFDDVRKAEVGSKRDSMLKQYGYVPKAASTAVRLAHSGSEFFKTGKYEVDVSQNNYASSIKFTPEKYTAEEIRSIVNAFDERLKYDYDNSQILNDFTFDEDKVNEYLLGLYKPFLL